MARREQEHTPLPYPNGWFAVAWSHELREGEVRPIHCFGEDLVLFRTRAGKPRVLDAFCPHLGAHLGHGGRVMGETVRCPFHGWQYDGETGACARIPYCERIPVAAHVRAWEVQEKNRMIFVWRHAEAKPPEWDFPAMPELSDPGWSEPRTFELEIPTHVQETHENNNDPVHFHFVHGMLETPPSEVRFSEDGRHYQITSHSETATPFGTFKTSLVRDSWGLGLSSVRSVGIGDAGLLMYSSTTPLAERRVLSRWLLTATKDFVDVAGEEFMAGLTSGVRQDLPIWANKVYKASPVLCEADTYLAQYRRWVKQFYSDPAARA